MADTLTVFFNFVDKSAGSTRAAAGGVAAVTKEIERQQKVAKQAERDAKVISLQDRRAQIDALKSKQEYLRIVGAGETQVAAIKKKISLQDAQLRKEEAQVTAARLAEQRGQMEKLQQTASGVADAFKTIATTTAMAAVGVGMLAYQFGKAALAQGEMARNTKASLGQALGGARGAALYDTLDQLSDALGTGRSSTISAGARLAMTGRFGDEDVSNIVAGIADLTAFSGERRGESMESLADILANAASNPMRAFDDGTVDSITSATGGLVTRPRFLSAYRDIYKKRRGVELPEAFDLVGLQSDGRGLSNLDLDDVVLELAKQLSGQAKTNRGKLGAFSAEYSQGSPLAQLERISDNFKRVTRMDEKGSEPLARFLERVNQLVSPEGATGRRMSEIVDRAFERFGGYLDRLATPEGMKEMEGKFDKLIDTLVRIAELMGKAAGLVPKAGGVVDKTLTVVSGGEERKKLGQEIKAEMEERARRRKEMPFGEYLRNLWNGTLDEATSPEKPLAAGALVTGPTRALVGEAGPEAVIPLSRVGQSLAGIGGTSLTLNMPITINGGDREAIEEATRRLESMMPSMFASAVERLNLQAGGAMP